MRPKDEAIELANILARDIENIKPEILRTILPWIIADIQKLNRRITELEANLDSR